MLSWLHSLQLDHPKILDVGCGVGWFTEQLADIGPATGIDLSEEAIRLARSRYSRASFLAGDVLEMPLPISEYDVVVSQEVIAHVPDQEKHLARAAQVLKPAGYLILTTPNRFVEERSDWPRPAPGHIQRWLSRRALMRLVRLEFHVLKTTTVVPLGHRGVLRIVNSYKLNRLLTLVFGSDATTALKERGGLGWTRAVLAQKRS
jgi:2-polyprenyl-3-methyl-5-hydroxy-6-metoxy-1,4-benzoquinol methylase